MHDFRSAQDEFVEIERRWRLLGDREKQIRAKELEIRQFMNYAPTPQQVPQQQQQHLPHQQVPRVPQWDNPGIARRRSNKRSRCFREDKDYSKLAATPYIDADAANNDAEKSP